MTMDKPLLAGEPTTVGSFGILALAVHAALVLAFSKAEYELSAPEGMNNAQLYNFYVGVTLMMFVGFGYLMTFLKAYGLGAIGFSMLITCLGIEFAVLTESYMGKGKLSVDFMSLLNADFGVAAVLISFGGLIGKVSPTQITVLTIVELACYCANKVYLLQQYADSPFFADCGGTVMIHVFGAYFGLCACRALGPPAQRALDDSSYTSDLFSFVGTLFLWLFWPSFVAAALPSGPAQTRALLNTVLALVASTVVTFAVTPLLMGGKLGTVPVQNATLAGGVAIGATANLLGPFGSLLVGSLAGLLSTVGFVKGPFFSDVDTCGISNLHGMPGILGGLVSIAVPFLYADSGVDAVSQAIGLAGTLAVACVTGSCTGFLLKAIGDASVPPFSDEAYWRCADDIAKVH